MFLDNCLLISSLSYFWKIGGIKKTGPFPGAGLIK